jgi:hypothetical protein
MQDNMLPDDIRQNLKKYKNHISLTCLECGYIGLMGVKKVIAPWFFSWFVIIAATAYLFLMTGMPFYVVLCAAFAIGAFRGALSKREVECPNCHKTLLQR